MMKLVKRDLNHYSIVAQQLHDQRTKRDLEVVRKFYQRSHLLGFINKDYCDFVKYDLKDYMSSNSRILLYTQYQKKEDCYYQYFLTLEDCKVQQTEAFDYARRRIKLDTSLAVAQGLSRSLSFYVQVKLSIRKKNQPETEQVLINEKKWYPLVEIPLLINSDYDRYRSGNFLAFIINGTFRTLYNTLTSRNNIPVIKKDEKTGSTSLLLKNRSKKDKYSVTELIRTKNNTYVRMQVRGLKMEFQKDVFEVLRALDAQMPELIQFLTSKDRSEDRLYSSMCSAYSKPIDQIYRKLLLGLDPRNHTEDSLAATSLEDLKALCLSVLDSNLFAHQTCSEDESLSERLMKKRTLLTHHLKDLYDVHSNSKQVPFKDGLNTKKVHTYRAHLRAVFNKAFIVWTQKIKIIMAKDLGYIRRSGSLGPLMRPQIMTKIIVSYLTQYDKQNSESYTESLTALNNIELISQQRKIVSPLNKNIFYTQYRSVNPSKAGRLDPIDTPNSKAVGLVERLTLGAKTSSYVSINPQQLLKLSNEKTPESIPVYFNEAFWGYTPLSLEQIYETMDKMDSRKDVSVHLNSDGYLKICTEEGRILKPFYRVKNEIVLIHTLPMDTVKRSSLDSLIKEGFICYLDYDEQMHSSIAKTPSEINSTTKYLWCHSSAYLSYTTNYLPLTNFNAAHRGTLSLRLIRQALGARKDRSVFDSSVPKKETLIRGHYPLLTSPYSDKYDDFLGVNCIIAFAQKQNQQDGIEANLSAIQRGLFDYSIRKKIVIESGVSANPDFFEHQDPVSERKTNEALEQDGLPKLGSLKAKILGVTHFQTGMDQKQDSEDSSHVYRPPAEVSNLCKIQTDYSKKQTCKITYWLNKIHKLKAGDKVGSRAGLKGVIGQTKKEVEMELTSNGIYQALTVADTVLNSRMITAPSISIILNKAAALLAKPFEVLALEDPETLQNYVQYAKKVLIAHNMKPSGHESRYNFKINETVNYCMGPDLMFLLEQHGSEKIYVRGKFGRTRFFTRQPAEGKKMEGGLRFGEMQRDAGTAHGATSFLMDRMNIDLIKTRICSKCGRLTAQLNYEADICAYCNTADHVREALLPYGVLLLTKHLKAAQINTIFELKQQQLEQKSEDISSFDIPSESILETQLINTDSDESEE